VPTLRRAADIVFVGPKVALFIDGCFWHGCPEHGVQPQANTWYWQPKLERNRQRDNETTAALEACGWAVVRVWEHEDPVVAADRVVKAVRARKTS
jgi:DNA mismatch endonuclease (patch repair protein)